MKIKYLLFINLIIGNFAFSQQVSKLDLIQGGWYDVGSEEQFNLSVYKDSLCLSFAYMQNDTSLNFPLFTSIVGFLNYNPQVDGRQIDIDSLNKNGEYFVGLWNMYINNNKANPKFGFVANLSFEEEMLVLFGTRESRWNKIEKLSNFAVGLLYKRGLIENVNYLESYLGIKACEITSQKAIIYDNPEQPTKMYLIQGDVPTIIEETDGWLKIEYLGKKLVTGWIKKCDTDLK